MSSTEKLPVRPFARRRQRRDAMQAHAVGQSGVLTRAQLYGHGLTRGEVRANIRADRWQPLGRHCIVLHTGPLTDSARWWAAVLEGGPRAFLDGEAALIASGLQHFQSDRIRVSVPRGARIRHRGTVADIRQTRRWDPGDVMPSGVPRSRPAVAAVRAALWAVTDRQATLLLTMSVQQKLTSPEELAVEALRVRRDKRRRLLHEVILEIDGGVSSINELDVVRGCRDRGIPEPDKQVLRRTSTGTYYLDLRWSRWKVVVEVDGIQHSWAQNAVADALRHNSIALGDDTVLRLPVLGLRLAPDAFFDQIVTALVNAGWRPLTDAA